jgi:cellulose synthase/poly-beta-1,6-N-acetylglucosamine synthase-like glycosyltransferase
MNLESEKLAVVIPAYNHSECLNRCLEALLSAFQGTMTDVLVIDDGSGPGVAEILRRYPVRFLRNDKNQGQSRSRNLGVSRTQGEYILFLDADVVVSPDTVRGIEQFVAMEKTEGLVGMQGIFSLQHPHPEWSSQIYNVLQHLLSREPLYGPGVNSSCLLIRRDRFLELGGFREDLWFMEDNELGNRLAAKGWFIQHGPSQFVHEKRVTWSWLFRTHLLGGKMQHVLARLRPRSGGTHPPSVSSGYNQVFLRWLLSGIMLLLAIGVSLMALNWAVCGVGLALGMVAFWQLRCGMAALWQVKPSFSFLMAGMLVFLSLPWIIVTGRCLGWIWGAGERERQQWRGGEEPVREVF